MVKDATTDSELPPESPPESPTMRTYVPKAPLSEFVEQFWYWKHRSPRCLERILPWGTFEFVIRLGNDRTEIIHPGKLGQTEVFSGALLTGPQTRSFVLDKSQQDELIGIHFRPGGAFPFFGMPANEFLDRHVSLESVCRADAEELRERLELAPLLPSKFQILESWLVARLNGVRARHQAVRYSLERLTQAERLTQTSSQESIVRMKDLADEVNLSTRRLSELFSREVGLAPKVFARLQRFQHALRCLEANKSPDFSEVALKCGYFDQSHFNHEFLEFSSLTPTLYLEKTTGHLGHVRV